MLPSSKLLADFFTGLSGGRKFLSALTLACVLQGMTVLHAARAADIEVDDGQVRTGDILSPGTSTVTMNVNSGGTASSTIVKRGGTLAVSHPTASLAGSTIIHDGGILSGSALTLDAGATLELERNGPATQATRIGGSGGFIKSGTGTLTLTGANTYTGATTVGAGTLALGAEGSIGPSLSGGGLILHGGACFDFSALDTTLAIPRLEVYGANAKIDTGRGTADFRGAAISYHVPQGAMKKGILLDVTGTAEVDASTVITITVLP